MLCTAARLNRNPDGSFGSDPVDACSLSIATTYGPDRIVRNVYDAAGEVVQEQRAYATSAAGDLRHQHLHAERQAGLGVRRGRRDARHELHLWRVRRAAQDNLRGHDDGAAGVFQRDGALFGRPAALQQDHPCRADDHLHLRPAEALVTKADPAVGTIGANTITTVYDLQNRATNVSDTYGNTLAMAYDNLGRKLTETDTTPTLSAKTVSYSYDNRIGDKVDRYRLTWPDGYYVNYGYDALGHLTTAVDSGGTTLATYGYDTLARRAQVQYNGTSGAKMLYSWVGGERAAHPLQRLRRHHERRRLHPHLHAGASVGDQHDLEHELQVHAAGGELHLRHAQRPEPDRCVQRHGGALGRQRQLPEPPAARHVSPDRKYRYAGNLLANVGNRRRRIA